MSARSIVGLTGLAACATLALAGCTFVAPKPSGDIATEFRSTDAFTDVQLRGAGDVTISQGDNYTVTVTTDSNYMERVTTTVEDGTLILNEDWHFNAHDVDVVFVVTVPSLESVHLEGAGNITVDGVDTDSFDAFLAGAGDITVSGTASDVHLSLAGVGDIRALDLQGATVTADLNGVGNISVSASDTLDATLHGVGDIVYRGDPDVTSSVAGIGSVHSG
jgi:hypothetical protein